MMIKNLSLLIGLSGALAAPLLAEHDVYEAAEHEAAQRGRELFPMLIGTKCARFCERNAPAVGRESVKPMMSVGDAKVKALEMLAINDDLKTVVQSDSMCTRRRAMARAAGLAAGLTLGAVNAPSFAAETKNVKMGTDSAQLLFVPDELTICKGDTVVWTNNKGGPHNVVFDEEDVPKGVDVASISMDGQLGEVGETFTKKFDIPGSYSYYCEPHRGAGMVATLTVE